MSWYLLKLLLLHGGSSAERVEDDVLVLFPVASLWVWQRDDVTLEETTKPQFSQNPAVG